MFDLMASLANLNILIILLTIISTKTNQSAALADAASTKINQKGTGGDFTVIEFLKDLQHLHNYDNVLLMHNKNTTIASIFYTTSVHDTSQCVADAEDAVGISAMANGILGGKLEDVAATTLPFVGHLMRHVQVPVVQLNELQQFNLRRQMTDDLLAIVQIDINSRGIQQTLDQHRGLLQKLSLSLALMSETKVLFLLNFPLTMANGMDAAGDASGGGDGVGAYADLAKGVVEQLFHHCWKQKLINIAAVMADYQDLQHLHNYDNVLLMHNKNTTIASIFYTTSVHDTLQRAADAEDAVGISAMANGILGGKLEDVAATTLPFVGHLMRHVQVPVVQLNELQQFNLRRQMTDDLLAIVQIDINRRGIQQTLDQHRGLLQKLSLSLALMSETKVLFLLNFPLTMANGMDAAGDASGGGGDGVGAYSDLAKGVVEQLFHHCWKQKLINIAAVMADYQITRNVYRFNPFPVSTVETVIIADDPTVQMEIYPYRLGNLLGYKMPIVVGGTDPRIVPYKTADGELFIGGFVGHFVLAFAKKYNCNLYEPRPFNPAALIPSQELLEAVRNGSVEWSAAVTFPVIPFRGFSYPYEIMNWCFMIPVEADIPGYTFFTSVFKGETYVLVIASLVTISMLLSAALYLHGYRPDILDILCHNNCLRGILGQPFTEIANAPKIIRAIYLEICILGILLTATYNAYFSTYVTKAPKESTLNTVDEVMSSGLKVVAWTPEFNEILGRAPEFKKYESLFISEPSFQKYLEMRDTFNTDYGYVVPTTKWTIVNEQQKIFTTPLFRQTPKFCFYNNIPMCFPVHENSVFNTLLYKLILETSQSGLVNHWMENGFMELIRANKLHFLDFSRKKEFSAMNVEDLQYIAIFLGTMWAVVLLTFAGELMVFYRWRIYAKGKRWFGKISRMCGRERNKVQIYNTETNYEVFSET